MAGNSASTCTVSLLPKWLSIVLCVSHLAVRQQSEVEQHTQRTAGDDGFETDVEANSDELVQALAYFIRPTLADTFRVLIPTAGCGEEYS